MKSFISKSLWLTCVLKWKQCHKFCFFSWSSLFLPNVIRCEIKVRLTESKFLHLFSLLHIKWSVLSPKLLPDNEEKQNFEHKHEITFCIYVNCVYLVSKNLRPLLASLATLLSPVIFFAVYWSRFRYCSWKYFNM